MGTYTENIANKLNTLLERTYDAEKGFKKAAENVENNQLKNYFNQKAKERYNFGHELKTEIKAYGQDVNKGEGSITGTLHRVWMDTKALFSLDSEESILEEVVKGEKAAIDEYEDILRENELPSSTAEILRKHKSSIAQSLNAARQLENTID